MFVCCVCDSFVCACVDGLFSFTPAPSRKLNFRLLESFECLVCVYVFVCVCVCVDVFFF